MASFYAEEGKGERHGSIKLMAAAGVTAAEVAQMLGLTTANAVYRWMNGTAVPSIDNLILLRDILGAGLDEILVTDRVA